MQVRLDFGPSQTINPGKTGHVDAGQFTVGAHAFGGGNDWSTCHLGDRFWVSRDAKASALVLPKISKR
jgi:hypothetical protein